MSSLSATQSDGYYLPPEYFESGDYKRVSRNRYAAETEAKSRNGGTALSRTEKKRLNVGHNQWLKHGVVRFELPEKAVCLGCRQSVGKGTRFNARKIKTDEEHLGTPVFELHLKCRNCQEPWVIRTDPKEDGFTYVSGVKRQAGQDRNLHESSASLGGAAAAVGVGKRTSLDALEAAAVAAQQPPTRAAAAATTGVVFRTELEELEALVRINDAASGAGRDVDHNASIRKTFRTDRREHRRRLVGATGLGWRRGMSLLPSSDGDLLAAKETCYGRARRDERANLSRVRRSSIFGGSGRDGDDSKKRKGKRKRRREATRRLDERGIASGGGGGDDRPEIVASGGRRPCAVASGGSIDDAVPPATRTPTQARTPTPDPTPSSSSPPVSASDGGASIPKKKTTTLRLSNGVVSVVGGGDDDRSSSSGASLETAARRSIERGDRGSGSKKKNPPKEPSDAGDRAAPATTPKPSLLDLVGSYGSSDDDDDG